jgi:hypothetical protein
VHSSDICGKYLLNGIRLPLIITDRVYKHLVSLFHMFRVSLEAGVVSNSNFALESQDQCGVCLPMLSARRPIEL